VDVSVAELDQVEEQPGRSRVRTSRYLRDGMIDDGWESVPETGRRQTGRGRADWRQGCRWTSDKKLGDGGSRTTATFAGEDAGEDCKQIDAYADRRPSRWGCAHSNRPVMLLV
jgi:hypothetical protein